MSLLSRIADRLILQPTTHFIETQDQEQKWIQTQTGKVELWIVRDSGSNSNSEPSNTTTPLLMLKFPGTGGRAERSSGFPANLWSNFKTETWTVNHRGYGGSDSPASLQNFTETCDALWEATQTQFPGRKILLYGNSLGCISAMYLAAQRPAAGLFLRNPPALARIIATRPRYSRWSFGLSKLIANQVPDQLDTVANAAKCSAPCLFVCSERDTVVPPRYQNMIIDAFAGPQRTFQIEAADHADPIPEHQTDDFLSALGWLGEQIL